MDTEAHKKTMNVATHSESQPTLDINPNFPRLNWGTPKSLVIEPVIPGGRSNPCATPIAAKFKGSFGLPIPTPSRTKKKTTHSFEKHGDNPVEKGKIKFFSRGNGHGYILSDRAGEDRDVFVHISDIEGEYVPRVGDEVTFRLSPTPPKHEKQQAIHVRICQFTPEVHLRWDSPLDKDEKDENIQTFVVD